MFWKIYFWCVIALWGLTYALTFMDGAGQWDVIDFVITATSIFGLYCYTYDHKKLPARFWSVWLIAILCWDMSYNLFISEHAHGESGLLSGLKNYLIILPIILPQYLAVFRLGYKDKTCSDYKTDQDSKEIKEKEKQDKEDKAA